MSKLDQNLTFEPFSRARGIQFEWISDLVLHITYKLKDFIKH